MHVFFQPITQGEITEYQVYYNTLINETSSTTLIFTAPSLPTNVFTDTVVVMVTAVNRYGMGPASEPETAVIYGKITFKQYFNLELEDKNLNYE